VTSDGGVLSPNAGGAAEGGIGKTCTAPTSAPRGEAGPPDGGGAWSQAQDQQRKSNKVPAAGAEEAGVASDAGVLYPNVGGAAEGGIGKTCTAPGGMNCGAVVGNTGSTTTIAPPGARDRALTNVSTVTSLVMRLVLVLDK
jgi:hypothetical protein